MRTLCLDCSFRLRFFLLSYSHTVRRTLCLLPFSFFFCVLNANKRYVTWPCRVVRCSFMFECSSTSFSSKFMDIVLLTDLNAEYCMRFFRRCFALSIAFFSLHLLSLPYTVLLVVITFRCVIDDFRSGFFFFVCSM